MKQNLEVLFAIFTILASGHLALSEGITSGPPIIPTNHNSNSGREFRGLSVPGGRQNANEGSTWKELALRSDKEELQGHLQSLPIIQKFPRDEKAPKLFFYCDGASPPPASMGGRVRKNVPIDLKSSFETFSKGYNFPEGVAGISGLSNLDMKRREKFIRALDNNIRKIESFIANSEAADKEARLEIERIRLEKKNPHSTSNSDEHREWAVWQGRISKRLHDEKAELKSLQIVREFAWFPENALEKILKSEMKSRPNSPDSSSLFHINMGPLPCAAETFSPTFKSLLEQEGAIFYTSALPIPPPQYIGRQDSFRGLLDPIPK